MRLLHPTTRTITASTILLTRRGSDPAKSGTHSARDVHAQIQMHLSRLQAKFPHSSKQPVSGLAKAGTSQPLSDHSNGLYWTGEIKVGTPPVAVSVDFDTGSADTLLAATSYDPDKSSTAVATGNEFETHYGYGTNAEGEIFLDTVSVGGNVCQGQAVGRATNTDFGPMHGVVGLAFDTVSNFKMPSLLDSLAQQGAIERPVFGVGLWTDGARLDIGQWPREAYDGEIVWNDVDSSRGLWTVEFEITGVEGKQTGIVDTGTTLLVGPKEQVTTLFEAAGMTVKQQGDNIHGVYAADGPTPSIALTFHGVSFTLDAESLQYRRQGDTIVSGIAGADLSDKGVSWVLGDTFLRNVYAAFDKGERPMVGFARKA